MRNHCSKEATVSSPVPAAPGREMKDAQPKLKTRYDTMPAIKSLRDLLVDELRDLHNAENQLVKALPKMAKASSNEELKEGFQEHLEQTREHVDRLDRCFKLLGANAKGKTCHAMK